MNPSPSPSLVLNPSAPPQIDDARGSCRPKLCKHLFDMAAVLDLGLNGAAPATLVVDLNCAFASIEQHHDPKLRGRPLAIAAYATDAATIVSPSQQPPHPGIRTRTPAFAPT